MKIQSYIFLLLSSLLILTQACKEEYEGQKIDAEQRPKAQLVKVEKLATTTATIPIEASGMIGSKAEMNLSFKIGGIIDRMYVREGQTVRKGQLLAQLKTTEIDAQVLKAQQGVDKSTRDLDRVRKLYADTAATLEQVQDLTTVSESGSRRSRNCAVQSKLCQNHCTSQWTNSTKVRRIE